MKSTSLLLAAVATSPVAMAQIVIFDHDFENAPTPGAAVTGVSDLGAPVAGSFSFSDAPVGGIGGNVNDGRFALAVGHNGNSDVASMTEMVSNAVAFSADVFPDTQIIDAGGGDRVYADFAGNGAFTDGESTTISFLTANFGTSNTGAMKYNFVRGLDANDNEIFELLFVSGSGGETREVFARGADDDSTTLSALNAGTPEGTKLVESVSFQLNGTNVAAGRPSGMFAASITLENGAVTYDLSVTGGDIVTTADNATTAFPVNSAATSIARLEFSSAWNLNVEGQNKGYWVDDIFADATAVVDDPGGFLEADFNQDGIVDLLDLDVLGANWQSSGATNATGDANGDTIVDLLDLDVLGSQWQQSSSFAEALAASGIAVPEPASMVLLAAGGLLISRRRR